MEDIKFTITDAYYKDVVQKYVAIKILKGEFPSSISNEQIQSHLIAKSMDRVNKIIQDSMTFEITEDDEGTKYLDFNFNLSNKNKVQTSIKNGTTK